ncbi:hypothetical protein [Natronoglycomyces albus]|uniref:Uncharacterized protein n=1 Tax=Natronoglycomyces albus TaxID=2811108 RepID=A0A895XR68_9ACTN|nr:hypothetical protein [Natronoglycomyces albus]QSB05056.1 hypothetical protein JQS30_15055 [Natronoglycomyces albus]
MRTTHFFTTMTTSVGQWKAGVVSHLHRLLSATGHHESRPIDALGSAEQFHGDSRDFSGLCTPEGIRCDLASRSGTSTSGESVDRFPSVGPTSLAGPDGSASIVRDAAAIVDAATRDLCGNKISSEQDSNHSEHLAGRPATVDRKQASAIMTLIGARRGFEDLTPEHVLKREVNQRSSQFWTAMNYQST